MSVILQRYRYSIYARIVAAVLATKGIDWQPDEQNPFTETQSGRLLHPFGRVPVLIHDGFVLYETRAICAYLDLRFDTPRLSPSDAAAAARMQQVIAIADSYGYWPMVRQVFAHRVFRPALGEETDESIVAQGLAAAAPVLAALDEIAGEGLVLNRGNLTLADLHLGPMIAAFAAAPEGRTALAQSNALAEWWHWMGKRPEMTETDPGLPGLGAPPGAD